MIIILDILENFYIKNIRNTGKWSLINFSFLASIPPSKHQRFFLKQSRSVAASKHYFDSCPWIVGTTWDKAHRLQPIEVSKAKTHRPYSYTMIYLSLISFSLQCGTQFKDTDPPSDEVSLSQILTLQHFKWFFSSELQYNLQSCILKELTLLHSVQAAGYKPSRN